MLKIFRTIFLSLAVVTSGLAFVSPSEVLAQSSDCVLDSEFWFSQSNYNEAVTSGPAGKYYYQAFFIGKDSGNGCANKALKLEFHKNGAKIGNTLSKATDAAGKVESVNVDTAAGATYEACFNVGAAGAFKCGQKLTINAASNAPGTTPAAPGNPSAAGNGAGDAAASGTGCENLIKSINFVAGGENSEYNQAINIVPHYCTTGTITKLVMNTLFAFAGAIAIIFIILGGYRFILSGGNAEMAGSGKKTLTYAVAGLVVVIMAYTIVNVVITLLTNTVNGTNPSVPTTNTTTPANNTETPGATTLTPDQAVAEVLVGGEVNKDGDRNLLTLNVSASKEVAQALCGSSSPSYRLTISDSGTNPLTVNGNLFKDNFGAYSDKTDYVLEDFSSPITYKVSVCGKQVKQQQLSF